MGTIILIVVLVLIVLWAIATYNSLVGLRMRVQEAFSGMDVYLKKRYDLIPNIVETVKGYAKHEQETLEKVINARNKAVSATTPTEKVDSEKELSGCISRLFALTESYPDLKADTQFTNLQGELSKIETDIAQARKYYNGSVKGYNTKVSLFPAVIIAKIFGFHAEPFFTVDDESERKNVKVQF